MNRIIPLKLKFDRITRCDWCYKKTKTSITNYGTTTYNRLICKECAKYINNYHYQAFKTYVFEIEKD